MELGAVTWTCANTNQRDLSEREMRETDQPCMRENQNDTRPGQRVALRVSKLAFLLHWNENKALERFPRDITLP